MPGYAFYLQTSGALLKFAQEKCEIKRNLNKNTSFVQNNNFQGTEFSLSTVLENMKSPAIYTVKSSMQILKMYLLFVS